MGNIHTKRRNRLGHEKVHDLATVAMDLDAQHQAQGLSRERRRWQFDATQPSAAGPSSQPISGPEGSTHESSSETDSNNSSNAEDLAEEDAPAYELKALATALKQAVDDDEHEEEYETGDPAEHDLPAPEDLAVYQPPRTRRLRLFFGTAHPIPLSNLFNFSDNIDGIKDGLGLFWKSGIYNMEMEKNVYEERAK